MHELSVVKSILKTVDKNVVRHHGKRVKEIRIIVGDLSSIVDDSLQYYFEILTKASPINGAVLKIQRTQAIASCDACGSNVPVILPLPKSCSKCHSDGIHISGGTEFYIDSIELV